MDIETLAASIGYPLIVLVVIADSLGVPLPSEAVLVASAAAAGSSNTLTLAGVIAAGAIGAVIGNSAAYWIGYRGGRAMLMRMTDRKWIRADHLHYAETFVAKYGGLAVLFGRFIPFVRLFAALVAGVGRMRLSVFLLNTIVGALLWATTLSLIGHTFGRNLPQIRQLIGDSGLVVIGVIAVGLALFVVWRRVRTRRVS